MDTSNPLVKALASSAVRWGAAFLVGKFGFHFTEEQIGEAAAWAAVAIAGAGSLLWSALENWKLLQLPPK